jgi:hypothetical protein
MADLYERGGDYRSAVGIYQSNLESLPAKERYNHKDSVHKIATLLDKLKEYKAELQLLKAYAAANPTDTSYAQKINELEKKCGSATTGPVETQGGASKPSPRH